VFIFYRANNLFLFFSKIKLQVSELALPLPYQTNDGARKTFRDMTRIKIFAQELLEDVERSVNDFIKTETERTKSKTDGNVSFTVVNIQMVIDRQFTQIMVTYSYSL